MEIGDLEEFRLVRPLGRGGMGEVYLGHDTVLDRAVAIKVIGAAPDAARRERFLTEARAIARLSHPNVVAIYRVGTTRAGRPFLVQELIRGISLDRLERPVPWRKVCALAIGLARGLEAAHRRGIIHRDVKPANVMLDEHGTARLLDFGLAKLAPAAWPDASTRDARLPPAAAYDSLAATADGTPEPLARTAEAHARTAQAHTRTAEALARTGEANTRTAEANARTGEANASTAEAHARTAEANARTGEANTRTAQANTRTGEAHARTGEAFAAPDVAATQDALASTLDADPVGEAHAIGVDAASEPGAVQGTPRYAAPEVWAGEPASARADLYSLGVMLYELLAGRVLFAQRDLAELEAAVLAGRAEPLVVDEAPALAALVMRCLARDPAARPASAAEIAHALEALLAGGAGVPEGNPYRGLRAFDASHRGLFFGRGADVEALVDRLRGEPLVAVVGDSGIGKSSVCHAGVAPAVAAGALGDRRRWRVVTVAPGRTPWTALCDALAIAPDPDEPADRIVRGLGGAADATLIVIDQLEELVTLSQPAEAARAADLIAAIAGGVPGVKALVAVRGDFLTRVAALPEAGDAMTRGLHLLRVLAPGDLREVVVGPARAKGVRYETEAMVDALVAAVADDPGALPLLQFTLAELWPARAGDVIPAAALAALGGVEGGLARHADAVLRALPLDARAAARRIVLRLVTPEATRAVRDPDELVDGPTAAAALESLVRGRIVVARDTTAGTPTYALAHDALIHGWDTLRDWLAAAAGQHAAHNRLRAAAAEWRRLDRRPDQLWTRRQLDEIRDLDPLTPDERGFVAASRRRLRRTRLARLAALAAAPLVALAIFAGVRLEAARTRARAVAARSWSAAAAKVAADVLAARAGLARAAAFAAFDRDDAPTGEAAWADARRATAAAASRYGEAAAELEAAFVTDADAVRVQMSDALWSHAELAEIAHDAARVTELLRRLATFDPRRAAGWAKPARLSLALDRPGRISVHRFPAAPGHATIAGGFDAQPVIERVAAQLEATLAPGSYVLVVVTADGTSVRDPILLGRGEHVVRALAVPRASEARPGFVFVPAGRFLFGAAREEDVRREFLKAEPMHPTHGRAFWIARTEVTYADWIAFLRALPQAERDRRRPAQPDVSLMERDGRYELSLEPSPHQRHHAREGQLLSYPGRARRTEVRWERLPITGVSYEDAMAYAAWLDGSGAVPGARVCTAREWEHAARGADGRSFPHGETLLPADANFDETYGRVPTAYGPDEVGSFPASDSPFGVADQVGNVWEWTVDGRGSLWYRGGSFYHERINALSTNANHAEINQRNVRIGLRLCADAARPR
jgi:serine/threonine protein kinase/formylglycine-generating enzyme required for sulfatase activity